MEKLEAWKKRVFVAFLLVASIFGASALLILEFGVVEKAWNLEWQEHSAPTRPARHGGLLRDDHEVGPRSRVGHSCKARLLMP